jgi:hypothetical protein
MTTIEETALARLEREERLLNPVFKAESSVPGRFLFRGEIAVKLAPVRAGEKRPPEIKADQVLCTGQAGVATIPFLAGFLLAYESLKDLAEMLGDLLAPSGKYFIFCSNIDLGAKYRVKVGDISFYGLPLDESTVYNEMLDLLKIDKNVLKKADTAGKLDAIANGAAKFAHEFKAIGYEEGLALVGPVRDPGENRPV